MMTLKQVTKSLISVATSLMFAGLFYSVWLAAFLLTVQANSILVEGIGWLTMPVATALGFTTGFVLFKRMVDKEFKGFFCFFLWFWGWCVLGAVIVYWIGPMVVVFNMFLFGIVGTVVKEVSLAKITKRKTKS